MKGFAIGIAVLGAIVLAAMLIPTTVGPSWLALAFEERAIVGVVLLIGALAAIGSGVLALVRGPLRGYHAAVATAGFALVFVRLRAWDGLAMFGDLELSMQALIGACVAGMAWSFVALVKAGP